MNVERMILKCSIGTVTWICRMLEFISISNSSKHSGRLWLILHSYLTVVSIWGWSLKRSIRLSRCSRIIITAVTPITCFSWSQIGWCSFGKTKIGTSRGKNPKQTECMSMAEKEMSLKRCHDSANVRSFLLTALLTYKFRSCLMSPLTPANMILRNNFSSKILFRLRNERTGSTNNAEGWQRRLFCGAYCVPDFFQFCCNFSYEFHKVAILFPIFQQTLHSLHFIF